MHIPLFEFVSIYLHFVADDIWVVSSFGLLGNTDAVNILPYIFWWAYVLASPEDVPRRGIRVTLIYLALESVAAQFSKLWLH